MQGLPSCPDLAVVPTALDDIVPCGQDGACRPTSEGRSGICLRGSSPCLARLLPSDVGFMLPAPNSHITGKERLSCPVSTREERGCQAGA